MLNSNLAGSWLPTDYGQMVDLEVEAKSVAAQVSTVVATDRETMAFPLWVSDPEVGFYAENTEIALTDGATDELIVVPRKAAGRTQISNEAVRDSNPAVAEQVGRTLARQIAKSLDAAFFAASTTNGPDGLESTSFATVDSEGFVNLDPFHEAKSTALDLGAEVSHFVLANDVALTLATLKDASGSNRGLLENVADGTRIAGIPVIVSSDVPAGTVWALDKSQIMYVRRTGTEVVTSGDAAFGFDALQVRATSRVGFGFVNPNGIVKIAVPDDTAS